MLDETRKVISTPQALDVLIIEDNPTDAMYLRAMLKRARAVELQVEVSQTFTHAMQHLATQPCDAVFLDLGLPDAEGLSALVALGAQFPHVPVIVLTGRDDDALAEQAVAAGAEDYLIKSQSTLAPIERALRHAIARHRLEQALRRSANDMRVLFDNNPYPAWVFDEKSLAFLAVNEAAIRVYGFSRAEFLAMTVADLCRPQERAAALAAMLREQPDSNVLRAPSHRRRDGSVIHVQTGSQPLRFRGHQARLVQARDVTAECAAVRAREASERRFRDLFEHTPGFICTHDMQGRLLAANPAAAQSLGYEVNEITGRSIVELMPETARGEFDLYLQRIAEQHHDRGRLQLQTQTGVSRIWQYENRRHQEGDGRVVVMVHAQDITERRQAEQALRRSEQRIRTLANALPLAVGYVDAQQRFQFVNAQSESFFGKPASDIVGRRLEDVFNSEDVAVVKESVSRVMAGERVTYEFELGREEPAWMEMVLIPQLSERSSGGRRRTLGFHLMIQDITARKMEEQRLVQLAQRDSLTGLHNRAGFLEHLSTALADQASQPGLVALMYLDIDIFKQVNDRYGHAVGDKVLQGFAHRLRGSLRSTDVVARVGGDEFTVIMEGIPQRETAGMVADKIIKAMRVPLPTGLDSPATIALSTSIGLAFYEGDDETPAQLLERADAMLYQAKKAGRNTYRADLVRASAAQG